MDKIKDDIILEDNVLKTIKFLKKVTGDNVDGILNNISFDDFKRYLFKINKIILNKSKQEEGFSESVQIVGANAFESSISYIPPKNKEERLLDLYNHINLCKTLEEKANYLYYGIQIIHPFSDGNGRLGRLLFFLLKNNFDLSNIEEINKILDNDNGRNYFEKDLDSNEKLLRFLEYNLIVNTYEIKGNYSGLQSGTISIKNYNDINENIFKKTCTILNSTHEGGWYSFRNYILHIINSEKKYTDIEEKEEIFCFEGEKILEKLTDDDCIFIINEFEEYQKDLLKLFYNEGVLEYFINN